MFLLLIVVALGGILTAWGIDRYASNRAPVSIVRSFPFWFAVLFGIALIVRVAVDSIFQPPTYSDDFIGWLNHGCFILSFASLSLFLHSIYRAPSGQQGPAAIIVGLVIAFAAATPLFHPGLFYPIFRSIFVITPSELIACVLFFIVGMSFVFAKSFWKTVLDHLAKQIPAHPFAAASVLSILFVSALLLATMPPFLSNWLGRINGIKTPYFEAQLSPKVSGPNRSIPVLNSTAWPYEFLSKDAVTTYIDKFKFHKHIRADQKCSLVRSLDGLDAYLKKEAYYGFLDGLDVSPDVRPPRQDIQSSARGWATRWKAESASTNKSCLSQNAVFVVLLANMFQISDEPRKSELALEEGIRRSTSYLEKGYLQSWLGYFLSMQSRALSLDDGSQEIISILHQSIANIDVAIASLRDELNVAPTDAGAKENLQYWRLFQLQTKSYYIAAAVDTGQNEWSVRRYAADLEAAIQQDESLKLAQPQFVDLLGWTKVRFHKDEEELREGRALLVEAESYVKTADNDRITTWKLLNVIRYHLAETDRLL